MGISPYLANLRSKVGHDLIVCPGVTGVVVRDTDAHAEVLLVQRVDNGRWTLISGAIDPGEDPDTAVLREISEETTIRAAVERLIWVQMLPVSTYPNGDQVQYMDLAFRCRVLGGAASVGDDESREVRWFPVAGLPSMDARQLRTIELALGVGSVRFGQAERGLD